MNIYIDKMFYTSTRYECEADLFLEYLDKQSINYSVERYNDSINITIAPDKVEYALLDCNYIKSPCREI